MPYGGLPSKKGTELQVVYLGGNLGIYQWESRQGSERGRGGCVNEQVTPGVAGDLWKLHVTPSVLSHQRGGDSIGLFI